MYLKDIDCPQIWHDKLADHIPPGLFYLNESTGDVGGLGAMDEPDPNGLGLRKGRGIAQAGDLMSSLPKEMRAENLMCYIGHEGTYTPAHREMCASLGQNIMVEASTGAFEDGKPTKPGSSIWFMTESKEREVVSEYWLSKLGHDIEIENHFAQINAWKNAPFKTYVVEQKPGDFILIPPLAPHQVWNRGTRTMKVAWNRTTVETLEMAMNEALPRARMVCRDEQYKNKAMIYYTLQKYSKHLRTVEKIRQKVGPRHREQFPDAKVRQVEKDFRRLHALFKQILVPESFFPRQDERKIELEPFDSNITCSYCRCNIFNRFLTCPSCVNDLAGGEKDTYDICMECYAMGRSCACISKLKWVEQFPWGELIQNHDRWRHQILQSEGQVTEKSPRTIKSELGRLNGRRTLAQICQLELIKRPFRDTRKPPPAVEGVEREEEIEVDDNGKIKKKKKKVRRSEKFTREHGRCHVDCHWEPKWKQAQCSTCDKNWCYGILFRAYDMMPQDIMADPKWTCPSCQNICGCRNCRHKPGYKPYTPQGTMLGHNTKVIADFRSVESLVDFSFSNISWIQKAGDDNEGDTRRLTKRRREADAAKAQDPELGDDYVADGANQDDVIEDSLLRLAQHEGINVDPGIPIDPALAALGITNGTESIENEDDYDENPETARVNALVPRGPMAPQDVVPEGGIIRDTEHAYDITDAITYDYPDHDMSFVAPVQVETQDTVLPPGYEPAMPDSPGEIEMVNRKRKRIRIDEGDKPYQHKKANTSKPKIRRSLIVKLRLGKEKLLEMNEMAKIAQQALNGAPTVPAPVVGSDLQALNANHQGPEVLPVQQKLRNEHVVVEKDDEFTPGRYRDRRKAIGDGAPRPPPDADITRRATRMQAVTYEDPSDEEEFNETVAERPARTKLATMEQATIDLDSESEAASLPELSSFVKGRSMQSPDNTARTHPTPATLSAESETTNGARHDLRVESVRKGLPFSAPSPLESSRPSTASSNGTSGPPAKIVAEAQANRRAKMAAIEWVEDDSASLDDAWSEEEVEEVLPVKAQAVTVPKVASIPPAAKPAQVRQSLPQMDRPTPQATKEPPKALSAKKVSASAWADSDSSEDESTRPRVSAPTGSAWMAVNANRPAGLKPAPAKRGRGRPPLHAR